MTLDEEMKFNGETRFTPGQEVIAVRSLWPHLTEGKTCTVIEFTEPVHVGGFRFPAYVEAVPDTGRPAVFHTHRFQPAGNDGSPKEN